MVSTTPVWTQFEWKLYSRLLRRDIGLTVQLQQDATEAHEWVALTGHMIYTNFFRVRLQYLYSSTYAILLNSGLTRENGQSPRIRKTDRKKQKGPFI